ncbi:putative transcription factor bHLH107 [Silene latifolia]|uniref:putative transcription factor bHLH107 n=1 Tax=Silene latifolia TaxID=37657 RepID=UPI003D77B1C1
MQHYMENNSAEMDMYRYMAPHGGVRWPHVGPMGYSYGGGGSGGGSDFYAAAAMGMMNDETAEAKAVAASRIHHKEAEKRRRERINSHLDRLRSLLPCTTKTDKATLLSKVVQRVLELKRQTSELHQLDNLMIPSENDEFAVFIHNNNNINEDHQELLNNNNDTNYDDNNNNNDTDNDNDNNKIILKASLCCEDRPDLFSDLNGVLDSLNLKTIRAEISSLGGRVQSVLIVSADNNNGGSDECAVFLRDALKGIVQRSGSEERLKRRRRAFESDC